MRQLRRHLKEFFALLLILAIGVAGTAFAAVDLDFARDNPGLFNLSVDSDREIAFITTNLNNAARSFAHKYESDSYYSSTEFDILVRDYFGSNPSPIYRLWVYYSGTKHLYPNSIAFRFGGKKYVFSEIIDKENITDYDNGDASEDMLIKFGSENLEFLSALESQFNSITEDEGWADKEIPEDKKIFMEIRGTETIEVELGAGFLTDFYGWKLAMISCDEAQGLLDTKGSPMKVTAE